VIRSWTLWSSRPVRVSRRSTGIPSARLFGKVAISFLVLPYGASRSLLCTETRTAITGAETARRFRRYWTAIGPFAAYIMRHWLALAKQNAERDGALTAEQTEQVRTRVRLLIDITARAGAYRKGLLAAAGQLSPEEAAIIVDLARHGMQVPQLHDLLCGGHVLVDDPQLYENWRFEKVSHLRLSSHHRDIDKTRYPDIGQGVDELGGDRPWLRRLSRR
jgi:hypothetical protein